MLRQSCQVFLVISLRISVLIFQFTNTKEMTFPLKVLGYANES